MKRCKKSNLTRICVLCAFFTNGVVYAQQTPPGVYSSSVITNAVRSWTARRPMALESDLISGSRTTAEVWQVTKYYDGYGRPLQIVSKQTSPLGKDEVTAKVYDTYGREQWKYLPFVSNAAAGGDVVNDGNFKTDPFQQQVAFYNSYFNGQAGETNSGPSGANWAYEQSSFEASPLNRVTASWPAGSNWVGSQANATPHKTGQQLLVNSTDNVQVWNIAAAQGSLPINGGAYTQGTLYKIISTGEQGNQVIEYRDMYDHMVLKKVQNTAAPDNGTGSTHLGWLCTYQVYDDKGNLRYIIPPAVVSQIDGSWSISQPVADELCYRFEYDALNRVIIKKMPGTYAGTAGEVWMVYDVRDRPVMVQDGNMRSLHQWLCRLYDSQDRELMTGLITSTNTISAMQTWVTSQTGANSSGTVPVTTTGAAAGIVVNNNPLPSGATLTPLTATFYDNYNWVTGTSLSGSLVQTNTQNGTYFITAYNSAPAYAVPITQSSLIQGQVTGHLVQVTGAAGQYLYSVNIYDDHGRIIQTQATNISGGSDIGTSQYDWNGRTLRSLVVHNKNGANAQQHLVASAFNYDAEGRMISITESISSTVNNTTVNSATQTLASVQYDELGRLHQKTLGNNIETLTYEYNPRGWLLGVNRSYAKTAGSNANYFGFDLGYDKGSITDNGGNAIGSYATPAFNGNIAGTVWKSRGDNQVRKYDYGYDAPMRLKTADFNQLASGQFNKTAGLDFSMSIPNYDPNGNIQSATQNGWLLGGSRQIDNLGYNYVGGSNNSNRLLNVQDNSAYNSTNPPSTLGDFHYSGTKTATTVDYGYDANGNVTSDANHSIATISYNYLNLPQLISFANNKGTIQYIYDATGKKLQKITTETSATVNYSGVNYPTSITTTTSYIQGFVYKSLAYSNAALAALQYTDKLQFVSNDEGRIRAMYTNTASPATITAFSFDYYIRDHLNNVRMVLTDEQQQDIYPAATLESSTVGAEQGYYNITNDAAHVVPVSSLSWWAAATGSSYPDNNGINNPGNPNPTATSAQVYKLNGNTGDRYGLGITLKVMAGDQVSIFGKSGWHNAGTTPGSYPISGVIANFLGAFAGTMPVVAGGHGAITGTNLNTAEGTILSGLLTNTLNQPAGSTAPKAAINWILFNDQFVPISVGTDLVSINQAGDVIKNHAILNIPMNANGYLYVYCSNESGIDVYFDNLQVVNTRGPILEETHYYPFGLAMAGISDRAWNKLVNFSRFQGKEIQSQEFSDGTGLEEYDFETRYYDHQLGRWHVQDQARQFASPYLAMGNNWPNGRDPNGQWFGLDDIIVSAIGFVVGYISYGLEKGNWGGKALLSGLAGAAIAEAGYLTLGGGLVATGEGVTTATGMAGTMEAAGSFAGNYAAADAMSLFTSRKQIHDAGDWQAFGLIAGYSVLSSVSAGFSSDFMGGKIDKLLDYPKPSITSLFTSYKGSYSAAVGGFISTFGKQILHGYNPKTGKWNVLMGLAISKAIFEGGFGSFLGHSTVSSMSETDAEAATSEPAFTGWLNILLTPVPGMIDSGVNYLNYFFWEWVLPKSPSYP